MNVTSKRLALVNVIGVWGYLSLVFQWCWSALILAYPYLEQAHVSQPSEPTETARAVASNPILSPLLMAISIAVTVLVLIAAVIVIVRLPRTVGKTGAKVTHASAQKTAHVIFHHQHKKVTKRARRKITYTLLLVIKLIAIALPLIVLCFAPTVSLDAAVVWAVAWWFGTWTFIFFAIQHALAHALRVKTDAIW